jgi:translation initiation factor IF-2
MNDTGDKKPLGLRPAGSRPGNVKQSFSHGRTKNVVVETKARKRVVATPPAAAPGPSGTATRASAILGDPAKRPAGISDAELERRMKALSAARAREAEDAVRRAAEEAAREVERQRRRAEIEARERDEAARAEEARLKAEEEAAQGPPSPPARPRRKPLPRQRGATPSSSALRPPRTTGARRSRPASPTARRRRPRRGQGRQAHQAQG